MELIAVEGDLVPAQGTVWPKVYGLNGMPYHFVHPYYRGDALAAAVLFLEPV